ncbi:MAG: DUF4124 domain-containing protein [Gammaproteobacteria bacterium]|jgi:hypothetical protein
MPPKQPVALACNYDYALLMNAKHVFLLLSTATVLSTAVAADKLYKSVDEQGNIVYSDTPTPGAEQLTPPPLSTVKSRPKPAESMTTDAKAGEEGGEEPAKKPPTKYTKFSIVQPNNDDIIWDNTGAVPVAIQLEPPLDTDNGHSIWVYVDGKAVVRKSQSLVQPLSNIDRGTHKIRAEIRDEKRKTLKRTQNITVHLKRASSIPRSGP